MMNRVLRTLGNTISLRSDGRGDAPPAAQNTAIETTTPEDLITACTLHHIGLTAEQTRHMAGNDAYEPLRRAIINAHRGHDDDGNRDEIRYAGGRAGGRYSVSLAEVLAEKFDNALFHIDSRLRHDVYNRLFRLIEMQYGIAPHAYDPGHMLGQLMRDTVDGIAREIMDGETSAHGHPHVRVAIDIDAAVAQCAAAIAHILERNGDLRRLQIISRFRLQGAWRSPAFIDDLEIKAKEAGFNLNRTGRSEDLPFEPADDGSHPEWPRIIGARPRKSMLAAAE
jgi:hypothetical protein